MGVYFCCFKDIHVQMSFKCALYDEITLFDFLDILLDQSLEV